MANAQQDPPAWFSLKAGTRWIYQNEWKSGDRARPHVDRWTTEETIIARLTVPEGLVVLRSVQPASSIHSAYLISRDRQPYLVHRNCLYVIGDGWDSQTKQLRSSYREYLAEGAVSPDFCFPLQADRSWGNNDAPWRVESATGNIGPLLPAQYGRAIHIFCSHFGSGGSEDVWFRKGIGVVAEHYVHNGTFEEYTKKLIRSYAQELQ